MTLACVKAVMKMQILMDVSVALTTCVLNVSRAWSYSLMEHVLIYLSTVLSIINSISRPKTLSSPALCVIKTLHLILKVKNVLIVPISVAKNVIILENAFHVMSQAPSYMKVSV